MSGSEIKFITSVFLVSLSFIITAGCSNNPSERIEIVKAKPFSDTIRAQAIPLKSDSLLYHPFRLMNLGDKYLLLFYRKENDFFHVYKLPAMQFLYKWGQQGRGPDEFIQPPDYLNHSNDTLIIHDMVLRKLRSYQITDSTLQNLNSQTLVYNKQRSPLNEIQRINDTLYFATYGIMSDTASNEYVALRPGNEELLFTFGKYPKTELTGFKKFIEFGKSNSAKPDSSKFITFYRNHDQYKIFNSRGELLKEVQIEDSAISKLNDATYRLVFHASNKYIYSAEIYESADSLKLEGASYRTSLEIWDWTGKSVYRAKFDRSIKQFTVSEKYRKLYGLSLENKNIVFKYDLPDILGLN